MEFNMEVLLHSLKSHRLLSVAVGYSPLQLHAVRVYIFWYTHEWYKTDIYTVRK